MSKLADYIRRTTRTEPAPLGFAAAAPRPQAPSMLCLVRLAENEAGKVSEAAAKGADGVIVDRVEPKKLKDQAGKANKVALGVRPQKALREHIASLREAGADFAVIEPQEAMAEALLDDKMGYVLTVGQEMDDTQLRIIGELGFDAIIVSAPLQPITVERMLSLRRIAILAHTPLLVETPANADASLLQVLRDSGVTGVILPSSALGKLQDLRQRIASLPRRTRRREERAEAVLPAAQVAAGHDEDEDED